MIYLIAGGPLVFYRDGFKIMEQAQKAGAIITYPAHDAFWGGYSGHFLDPDGHLWEIVWNPEWEIGD